jgi:hypothetical protein
VLASVVIVAIRAFLAWGVPSPLIFPDELVYTKLARSLFETGQTLFRGEYLNFPTLLYPLLLVPLEGAPDAIVAFRLIQGLNILLMTSAIIPVYLLARTFIAPGVSLGLAVLSQLLASTLYADFAMTENLFFPVLMWAAFLAVRAAARPEWQWKAGLGLVLAIGFFTKPHGMVALPIVLGGLALASAIGGGREGAWRRFAAYWPAFAILGAAIAFQLLRSLNLGGGHVDANSAFGSYAGAFGSGRAFNLRAFVWAGIGTVQSVAMSVGFLPLVLAGLSWVAAWRKRSAAPGEWALTVFTVALGVLLITITSYHTVMNDDGIRLHERYCFHLAPLLLVGATLAVRESELELPDVLVGAIFALTGAIYIQGVHGSPLVVDSLTLSAFLPLMAKVGSMAAAVGAGIVMPALVFWAGMMIIRKKPDRAAGILAAYMVAIFGLAYVAHRSASTGWGYRARYVPFIKANALPDRPIAFLVHGEHFWDSLMAEFHVRTQTRYYQLYNRPQGFNEQQAGLSRWGELEALSALPDGARVVAPADVPLALPRLGEFEGLVMYEKRGVVKLAWLPPEVSPPIRHADRPLDPR